MKSKSSKKNRIARLIGDILVSITIFVVLFLVLSMVLPKFKYSLVIIRSGSMEPTIKTGSIVISKQSPSYSTGDIITFKNLDGNIITHRITEVFPQNKAGVEFRTKGDNNKSEDMFLVNQKTVIGKTLFSMPFLGYVISFAKTIPGIIIIFVIPASWIAFGEIKKIKREIKNKKTQKDEENKDQQ